MSGSSWTRDAIVRAALVALLLALAVPAPCPAQGGSSAAPATEIEAQSLFRFPVGGVTTSGPVVAAGRVWLLSDSKTLYVVTVDGVAVGRRTLDARRTGFIVGDAFGRAAISDGASGISLINRAGQEVWRVELGFAPARAPLFGPDGRLYIAAGTTMLALAPNGRLLWRDDMGAEPCTPLSLDVGGGPVVGLTDGSILSYTADGAPTRRTLAAGTPAAVVTGAASTLIALTDGRFCVLPFEDSGAAPLVPSGPSTGAGPVAAAAGAGAFYLLSARGALVCIDPTGAESWRTMVRLDTGAAALEAYRDRVVVLTRSAVYSYGLDGAEYRTLRLRNASSMPAMAATGTVFVGGADWIMYAYRFERPLTALDRPALPKLDLASIDAVADQESLWSLAPFDDSTTMNRLADIEKSIGSGTIGVETDSAVYYLSAVALGRMEAPFGSGASAPAPMPRGPMPRAYACNLLGMLGLAPAVPILVQVFERDPDPAVRSASAAAIAAIGLDPEGLALGAFVHATEDARLDARTASAIVDAIDSLYRASGALDDRSGILALVRISGGNYPSAVRSRAEQALRRVSSAQ